MANKKAAVAYRQADSQPWLGIKGVASNGDLHQMFKDARLDNWNMQKTLITTGAYTDSPDYEITRQFDGRTERLHISKERYEIHDNESALHFASNAAFGDLEPNAMGSLNGGRKVFMSFKIGDQVAVAGDSVQQYLHVLTSHDGSWAFGAFLTNMRLRCQNQLAGIRSSATSRFSVRHTATIAGRVETARSILGLSIKQNDLFKQEMEVLAKKSMTTDAFWDLVTNIYPKPEKDVRGAVAKWEDKTSTLMGLWNGSTLTSVDNTAYKAYNALNEHLMWYGGVRGGNVENALMRSSGFDEATNRKNVDLYRRVLATV